MTAFYLESLGFEAAFVGEDHHELRSEGLTIWLVRGHAPAPRLDAGGLPARRTEVALKLCIEVADIAQVVGTIASSGGRAAKTTWEFGGYLRRDAADPEGNVIQLLEAAHAPAL
jgi:hypothetical protein